MKLRKPQTWISAAGVAAALFLLAVLLQRGGGAYESEFGGHPDEAAHFITGLMVRDYLLHGMPQHPMRFAENYYEHYPKVAMGHYPPGFYALEGLWLAAFPVSRTSALLFMAGLSASFGLLLFLAAKKVVHQGVAAGVAALSVALPLTQTMTATVMSDLGLAICVFLAAMAFVRYLECGRWQSSLAFGLWATAATMMKGSGLFLALVPPLAILLARRFDLLKRPSLWIAVVPVALICGPWMLYSRGITSEGMIDRTPIEHIGFALPYFGRQFVNVFSVALLVPAVAGAIRSVRNPNPFWAVVVTLPVAAVLFYSIIPAGLEPRYLLPIIPSILLLAVAGIDWIPGNKAAIAVGAAVLTAFFALGGFRIEEKNFSGFEPAAEALLYGGAERLLVSSDPRGEGAFIVEVAIRDAARPSHTVKRASKVLASSDWLGRDYALKFATDAELVEFLKAARYDGIVVDRAIPEFFLTEHHIQVARVLADGEARSSVAKRPRRSDGEIRFYDRPYR